MNGLAAFDSRTVEDIRRLLAERVALDYAVAERAVLQALEEKPLHVAQMAGRLNLTCFEIREACKRLHGSGAVRRLARGAYCLASGGLQQ